MSQSEEPPLEDGVLKVRRDGRRVYSREFRLQVVAQCREPGVSVSGVAMSHAINANLVRRWIDKYGPDGKIRLVPVEVSNVGHKPLLPTPRGTLIIEFAAGTVRVDGVVDSGMLRQVISVMSDAR